MSLINDALKKAQKQRTGESPPLGAMPSIGGEPAARIAKRGQPPGFNSLLTWIGLGGTALLVFVVGGFFLVRWMMSSPPTPPAKPALVTQSVPAPVESKPVASVAPPPVNNIVTPAPLPVPAPVAAVETKPVVNLPVAPPPEPEPAKPALPALKMESKAVAYIEALRVAGIRASATDSKVLMNDRVYRSGDIVEHQLGLKLAVITAGSLTFEDERGARYTRNF